MIPSPEDQEVPSSGKESKMVSAIAIDHD